MHVPEPGAALLYNTESATARVHDSESAAYRVYNTESSARRLHSGGHSVPAVSCDDCERAGDLPGKPQLHSIPDYAANAGNDTSGNRRERCAPSVHDPNSANTSDSSTDGSSVDNPTVRKSSAVALHAAEPTAAVLREPDSGALPADAASTMHCAAESISNALPAEPATIVVREPDSGALPTQSASDVLSAESASNALPTEPTASVLREPDSALPAESAPAVLSAEPAAATVREPASGALSANAAPTVHASQPTAVPLPGEPTAGRLHCGQSAARLHSGQSAASRLHSVQSAATRLHGGQSYSTVFTELAELSGESELHSTTNHDYADVHAWPGIHSGRRGWSAIRRSRRSGSRRCRTGVHVHAVHVSHQYAVYVHATDQHVDHYSNALYTVHAGNTHDRPYTVHSQYRIGANHTVRWRRRRIWRLLA